MLHARGLLKPDGRWLYAYRLSSAEYQALHQLLRNTTEGISVQPAFRNNRKFAALFVLYASEWWRREYNGGAWKWRPILDSLRIREVDLSANERSEMVLTGFAFWGLRPADEGKRYFGTVVAHGGLPLKLIGQGGSRLNTVMGTVLRQAMRYGWNEDQVFDAITDYAQGMPESLRHGEVFHLLAKMVLTTLDLKQRHQLGSSADPIVSLDDAEPSWRDRYPLQIDDAAAAQLLTNLIVTASQIQASENTGPLFQVVRTLSRSDRNEWRLESRVAHPSTASAAILAQQFAIPATSKLPRYFEVDAIVGERRPLTGGRLLLGSGDTTVAFGVQRQKWFGQDACNEHLLQLRSGGSDLVDGGISLPGGESLVNMDAPWVFVEEGEHYRLVGAGDRRLPESSALVAVFEGFSLETLDPDTPAPEHLGRLNFCPECTLDLWHTVGSVLISGSNDTWHVRLGQTRQLSGSLLLEGKRVEYPTRPWPVIRGKPHVVRYDNDGSRAVIRSGLQWLAAGSKNPIDPSRYHGPVELQVLEDGERIGRFRFVLVSAHAKERFFSGDSAKEAGIEFTDWGFTDISIAANNSIAGTTKQTAQGHSISLQVDSTPPKDVEIHLHWAASHHELRVRAPFPARGGRAFDTSGKQISKGSVMSLQRAADVNILIFDQNPDQPKKYEIELELRGDAGLTHSGSSVSRRSIPIAKGFAEVRLLDLYGEIEALLGSSNELDARVDLSLNVGGKRDFSMTVSRYDVALQPTVGSVTLAGGDLRHFGLEQLKDCEVLALPLLQPGETPQRLIALSSEGVPCGAWATGELQPDLAPWLIYPAQGSSIGFRPLCIGPDYIEASASSSRPPDCELAAAIRIETTEVRNAAIDTALSAMAEDYGHDSWAMLDGLCSAFGSLPLCSIDTFKILATRPEVVVSMLIRSQLPNTQLAEHVRQLQRQLGLALELVGLSLWRRAIARLSAYWSQCYGEDLAEQSFPIILRDRLQAIAYDFPALRLNMDWLRFEQLNDHPQSVLDLQKDIASDPESHLKRLWQGENSLLQRLLLRTHADEDNWPEPRFFKAKAFKAFRETVLHAPNMKGQLPAISKFFPFANDDFKDSAANAPVLCALWCALDLPIDWWGSAGNRLALQRLRAFDPLWFEDAYRHAFAACIGLGLIEPPRTKLPSSSTRLDGSPRVRRVSTGTVQRISERIN